MLEGSDPVFNRTAFKHAVQHLKKCIEACSVCKTTNLGLLHLSCSYTSFLLAFMVLTGPLALHRLTVCCSCTDAIHTISPFHDACYGKGKEGGKKTHFSHFSENLRYSFSYFPAEANSEISPHGVLKCQVMVPTSIGKQTHTQSLFNLDKMASIRSRSSLGENCCPNSSFTAH